ncbi:MAG: exodeoxyribonuclease III [Phycicoccus sp.]
MLLATANVNGIRAALRRGGVAWLDACGADIVTLQEVRASSDQLRAALRGTGMASWEVVDEPAVAAGRAGVAVLSRHPVAAVRRDLGAEFAGQGRWVEVDVEVGGEVVTVASAYVHTGEAGTPRQEEKERFLAAIGDRVATWSGDGRLAVLTGDLNVAHRAEDLKNWKGNVGKAGYLPSEQAHLDRWSAEHGIVDVHRELHGPGPGPYTWWSWRGKAFDNDAGWRIDYQLVTAPLARRAVRAWVGRAASYAERWSDHAPVLVDYGF